VNITPWYSLRANSESFRPFLIQFLLQDDNKLTFVLRAYASDGAEARLHCSVTLEDVNDERPYFTNQTYFTRLLEVSTFYSCCCRSQILIFEQNEAE
jgi:hypothetical protein